MGSQALEPKATGKQKSNQVAVQRHHAMAAISPHTSGANYSAPSKNEVLDGIARGYQQALAGDHKPIAELLDDLDA